MLPYPTILFDFDAKIPLSARSSRKIRIAVLDDHPVIMWGLTELFKSQADMDLKIRTTDPSDFLNALDINQCDVAIVDFSLPTEGVDGTSFLRKLHRRYASMHLIVFSAINEPDIEYAVYRAGARGFISKSSMQALLLEAIRKVILDPTIFLCVRDNILVQQKPDKPNELLTVKEIEVLRYLAGGAGVTEIAEKLFRSPKTISAQKRSAMRKIGIEDDLSLAIYLKDKFRL